MSIAFRQRRLHYGLPACLMGLVFVLAAMLGPLSLYRCQMAGGGISLEQHRCCASKAKIPTVKAARSVCCEQVKISSAQAPTVVPHTQPQLDQLWVPVLAVLYALPALERPYRVAPPPSGRGPPVRPLSPPAFLLNASFLC